MQRLIVGLLIVGVGLVYPQTTMIVIFTASTVALTLSCILG